MGAFVGWLMGAVSENLICILVERSEATKATATTTSLRLASLAVAKIIIVIRNRKVLTLVSPEKYHPIWYLRGGGVTQANIYCGTTPDSQILLVQLMVGKRGKTG